MEITVTQATGWKRALNAARATVGKAPIDKEPSDEWKRQMLLAEHSPIRLVEYDVQIKGVKSWIATHIARHHVGIEKFICTQRDDRTGEDRDSKRQDSLVDMSFSLNAQALISISRKRLCSKAHRETRELWHSVIYELSKIDSALASKCVPECIYRGFCPEKECCGSVNTAYSNKKRDNYINK